MWILVALALGLVICGAVRHNTNHRRGCLNTHHPGPNTSMGISPNFGNISTILYWAHHAIQLDILFPLL